MQAKHGLPAFPRVVIQLQSILQLSFTMTANVALQYRVITVPAACVRTNDHTPYNLVNCGVPQVYQSVVMTWHTYSKVFRKPSCLDWDNWRQTIAPHPRDDIVS